MGRLSSASGPVEPTVGIVHSHLNRFSPNSNHAWEFLGLSSVLSHHDKVKKHNHHDATVDCVLFQKRHSTIVNFWYIVQRSQFLDPLRKSFAWFSQQQFLIELPRYTSPDPCPPTFYNHPLHYIENNNDTGNRDGNLWRGWNNYPSDASSTDGTRLFVA